MLITSVRVGDVIREPGGAKTEVRKIQYNACSSRGVHVNRNDCYDQNAHVTLAERATDIDGPCPRCGGDHSWCQSVQDGEYGYSVSELVK